MGNRPTNTRRNGISTSDLETSTSRVRTNTRTRQLGTTHLLVEGQLNTPKAPLYYEKTKPMAFNLRKETLKATALPDDPSLLLVEFIFDASVAGYITVYHFARHLVSSSFTSFEGKYEKQPGKTSFQPGSNQFYRQKPWKGLKVCQSIAREMLYHEGPYFPLVIVLESKQETLPTNTTSRKESKASSNAEPTAQITFGTFVRNTDNTWGVKCLKQQMVVQGHLYQLEDIFGLEDNISRNSQLCLVCMLDPINTLLLPCRHLCLCTECAQRIRSRCSGCPLCRNSIERIVQIHSPFLRH